MVLILLQLISGLHRRRCKTSAIWAVGLALIVGIITAILFDYQRSDEL